MKFDAAGMSLAYESSEGLPNFVKNAIKRWSVHAETEATCIVQTHATLELRGLVRLLQCLLERRLQADGARVLEELRFQVEHDRPHPRKVAAA